MTCSRHPAAGAPSSVDCKAVLANLPTLIAYVSRACDSAGIDVDVGLEIRLIAEEACTNAMRHGYPAGSPGFVALQLQVRPHRDALAIVLTLRDDGVAFDPVRASATPRSFADGGNAPGGWGLTLIRKLSDAQHYRRAITDEAQLNVLTVVKILADRHVHP